MKKLRSKKDHSQLFEMTAEMWQRHQRIWGKKNLLEEVPAKQVIPKEVQEEPEKHKRRVKEEDKPSAE